MWPFTAISQRIKGKKLEKKCLEEILSAIKERGIELLPAFVHRHRDLLEDPSPKHAILPLKIIKVQELPYSLTVLLENELMKPVYKPRFNPRYLCINYDWKKENLIIPENTYIIGETRNLSYDTEKENLEEEIKKLESEGLIKIVDGNEIRKKFEDELAPKHQEWEKISRDEWKIKYKAAKKICPSCGGCYIIGVDEVGDYTYGLSSENVYCGDCKFGKVSLDKFIRLHEPVLNKRDVRNAYDKASEERHQQILHLSNTNERLKPTLQKFHVYLKIAI